MKIALEHSPPAPSWVETDSKDLGGLDLLGLRTPVNTIGNVLINGVTTISPIIRYIGLRAWTTMEYGRLGLPDSQSAFMEFATRVEAAVVIGNILEDPKKVGLIGSDAGHKAIEGSDQTISLESLAMQPATAIYQNPSSQLGISFDRAGRIAGLTEERGLPLAQLVDKVLFGTALAEKLRSNPFLEELTRTELQELGAAFPIETPTSEERKLLACALMPSSPRDGMERNRAISYGMLLEIAGIQGSLAPLDLLDCAVDPDCSLLPRYGAWLDAWACYVARDSIAVAHECALEAMLQFLARAGAHERAVHERDVIAAIMEEESEMKSALDSFELFPSASDPLDTSLQGLMQLVDARLKVSQIGKVPRWSGLREQDVIRVAKQSDAAALAMLPVAWVLARKRANGGVLGDDRLESYLSLQGWDRLGIEQVLVPTLNTMLERDVTIRTAILELGMRTLDQHTRVAWSRIARDPLRDVALFTVDGRRYLLKEGKNFRAGRTASRLVQAVGWLHQLGLLEGGICTSAANTYIERTRRLAETTGTRE